jgi:hypothetical protein
MPKSNPNCWPIVAVICGLLPLGCSSSSSDTTTESQTLIGIDPANFVASNACGNQLMSYVATLYDDTGAAGLSDSGVSAGSFLVASSPPKSCSEAMVFSNVVKEHAYRVDLQGYTQAAADLAPAASGSNAMLLIGDSSYVTPTWTASCYGWRDNNGQERPGYAYEDITVHLTACSRLGTVVSP